MAELLVEYENVLRGDDGTGWVAHSAGRQGSDRMWEGWVEFVPVNGSQEPLRTACESRQPNRKDLVYWATGLTPVYLEGAFARAISAARGRHVPATGPRSSMAPRRPRPT